jgi:hypothetical protein
MGHIEPQAGEVEARREFEMRIIESYNAMVGQVDAATEGRRLEFKTSDGITWEVDNGE